MDKVELSPTGCWLWRGNFDPYGFPITSVCGRVVRVRQENFLRRYGYRPTRIDMKCGAGKICINPEHMIDSSYARKQAKLNVEFIKIEPKIQYLKDAISSISGDSRVEAQEAVAQFTKELAELEKTYQELIQQRKALDSQQASLVNKEAKQEGAANG